MGNETALTYLYIHTYDSTALQSEFAMPVFMASARQRGLGIEAIVLATNYPK